MEQPNFKSRYNNNSNGDDSYRPGDGGVARSDKLLHGVRHWKPALHRARESDITPGKVSWVLVTHRDVHDLLKDQPPNYSALTAGGPIGRNEPASRSTLKRMRVAEVQQGRSASKKKR